MGGAVCSTKSKGETDLPVMKAKTITSKKYTANNPT